MKVYVTIDGHYHKSARSYIGAVKMAFRLSSAYPSSDVKVVIIPDKVSEEDGTSQHQKETRD